MIHTYKLYNGKVELTFDDEKHWYFANGDYVPSVTGITKYLDKSGPLMWWAVKQTVDLYKQKLKPGKVIDEVQLSELHRNAQGRYRDYTAKAATIGTLIHTWIQDYIEHKMGNLKFTTLPINKKVQKGAEAFLEWEKEQKSIKYIYSEKKVYSMKYHYSGTCDLVADIDGKRCLIDFKTGKGPYYEHVIQTAAYKQALEEELMMKIEDRWIIRINKDNGEFEAHKATLDKEDLQAFKDLLGIYKRHRLGILVAKKEREYKNY